MENHHSDYQEDPPWVASPNVDPSQNQFTPHDFQTYPADGFYPQFQTMPMPMPLPSQLVNLNSSNSPNNIQGSFQQYSGQGFTSSGSKETMAAKEDPYIQTYSEFTRGSTIGDPVSVEDEKGRMWQNYKPDKYFLPNDAVEQDRLDFTHKGFCIQLHNMQDPQIRSEDPVDALHLAPIRGDPPRVLDIATGTGIWAIEYARRHPGSEVIGSDLSLIQPDVSATVPNVSFVREDAEDDWVFGTPFDFIHARLIFSCFEDHRVVIKKAFDNLRPGGWIEYQDSSYNIDSEDNSHRRTALHKWTYLALAGAAAVGRDLEVARKYKEYFIEAGFVDVEEFKFKMFGNAWPEKEPDRTLGQYTNVSGAEVVRTISGKLLGKGLGLPEEIIEPIVSQAEKDVNDTNIRFWWPGFVVYGRKPLDHEKSGV